MDRPGSVAAATRPGYLAHRNAHADAHARAVMGSAGHDRGVALAAIHTHAPSGVRCSARGTRDRGSDRRRR
jgi:hypothetical protein